MMMIMKSLDEMRTDEDLMTMELEIEAIESRIETVGIDADLEIEYYQLCEAYTSLYEELHPMGAVS